MLFLYSSGEFTNCNCDRRLLRVVVRTTRTTADHAMSLMSQIKVRGKSFISLSKTSSNLSFWATVKWFFQSPTVPDGPRTWKKEKVQG